MDKLPIRVVIADSHDLFRQGLSSLLTRQLDIKIVGEAKDGAELLQMMHDLRPDVLLMEVYMRGVDGLQTVYDLIGSRAARGTDSAPPELQNSPAARPCPSACAPCLRSARL